MSSLDYGPCEAWVTVDEVSDCCTLPESSNPAEFDDELELAALSASELLYELSGRQFVGLCTRTVRPCSTGCGCNWQVLSRGHVINWGGDSWLCDEATPCGCRSLSQVRLPGYPVQAISEVKIDGDIVASSEYRLDEHRYLTRLNGERWPGCQRMDLAATEDGTFAVTYTYGLDPPQIGKDAAAQLACEVFKSCQNLDDCALPAGATRITRQGIVIERTPFQRTRQGWATGLSKVDYFLNTVNPHGLRRPPTVWGPTGANRRFARKVG